MNGIPKAKLLSAAVAASLLSLAVPATGAEKGEVEALREQLKAQQQMLEELQRALAEQQRLTERLLQQDASMQSEITRVDAAQKTAPAAASDKGESVVFANQDKVKVTFSGQVNRMINIADDGESTETFFVDNDVSNTRVRFLGSVKATDDLTIGTHIEYALAPDESSEVSQDNESPGDFFDERFADISLASKTYGTFSLGKGSMASDGSAEVDLSMTDVVQYASIADIVGGLKFRDKAGNLTDLTVGSAFQDQDGLGRASRLRYDTPTWGGFHFATAAGSDERYDGAVGWSGKIGGVDAAGAFGVGNRNKADEDLRYSGSFSLLHQDTGLNFTLSMAKTERDSASDQENYYAKVGWKTNLFSVGPTAFGVDYTDSSDTGNATTLVDGDSVSFAMVQEFSKFGTELYAILRNYSLDSDGPVDYEDITVGSIGARVKF